MTNYELGKKMEVEIMALIKSIQYDPFLAAKVEREAAGYLLDHADQIEDRGRDGYRMSSAGDYADAQGSCNRRAYMVVEEGVEQEPLDGRVLLNFSYGDMIEALILAYLKQLYRFVGEPNHKVLLTVNSKDGLDVSLPGTVDCIIQYEGKKRVVEIKSVNSRAFFEIKKSGSRVSRASTHYQHQCYLQAMLPEGEGGGIIISVNKDLGYIYCEFVDLDPTEVLTVINGVRYLKGSETRPPRPDRNKSDRFPCAWKTGRCGVYEICWKSGVE